MGKRAASPTFTTTVILDVADTAQFRAHARADERALSAQLRHLIREDNKRVARRTARARAS